MQNAGRLSYVSYIYIKLSTKVYYNSLNMYTNVTHEGKRQAKARVLLIKPHDKPVIHHPWEFVFTAFLPLSQSIRPFQSSWWKITQTDSRPLGIFLP